MYGNTQTALVQVLVRIHKKTGWGNRGVIHIDSYIGIVLKDIFMPFEGKIQMFPLSP